MARLHQRLGTAGFIISIVALVAALGGGAYAAAAKLNSTQKKEVTKIAQTEAKKYAGKQGAPGTNGTNGTNGATGAEGKQGAEGKEGPKGDPGTKGDTGAPGAKGDPGTPGAKGDPGTPGASPTVISLQPDPSATHCKEGGAKIIGAVEPSQEEAFACSAEAGSGGSYPETLPSGRTELGMWEVQGEAGVTYEGAAVSTISFPLPLESWPTKVVLVAETPDTEEQQECPGQNADPKAAPGILCLYPFLPGASTVVEAIKQPYGAIVFFELTDEMAGSWAVTAE